MTERMTNHEYLQAYMDWKDIVNTEDVDTPERFDAYLRDRANEAKLEEIKELLTKRLEELDNKGYHQPGVVARVTELLTVAEFLGMNTEWWQGAKVLDATGEKKSFAEVENGTA